MCKTFPDEFYKEGNKEEPKKVLKELDYIYERLQKLTTYLGDDTKNEQGDISTVINEIHTTIGYINNEINFLEKEILKLK